MADSGGLTSHVAEHYNKLQENGLEVRAQSRIFYLRNFNNWMKSIFIGKYLNKVREELNPEGIRVLDFCCGKGGDLLKWKKGNIKHLVCADIAGTSVEQARARFREMTERDRQNRHAHNTSFTAEFFTADLTKARLRQMYKDPAAKFDLTSCQFSYHYSFESLPQAHRMFQNATESLAVGGYFIGTTPNANEIVKRLRAADDMEFGNNVYRIKFAGSSKTELPLFGCKYDFHLEGVVDCPEFLVNIPMLERIAARYGMRLVQCQRFDEFFEEHHKEGEARKLMGRMQSLEPYPADEGVNLTGSDEKGDYGVANDFWKGRMEEGDESQKRFKVGTLSKAEWEAATVYLLFAFKKESDEPLDDGTPSDIAAMLNRMREAEYPDPISNTGMDSSTSAAGTSSDKVEEPSDKVEEPPQ